MYEKDKYSQDIPEEDQRQKNLMYQIQDLDNEAIRYRQTSESPKWPIKENKEPKDNPQIYGSMISDEGGSKISGENTNCNRSWDMSYYRKNLKKKRKYKKRKSFIPMTHKNQSQMGKD